MDMSRIFFLILLCVFAIFLYVAVNFWVAKKVVDFFSKKRQIND